MTPPPISLPGVGAAAAGAGGAASSPQMQMFMQQVQVLMGQYPAGQHPQELRPPRYERVRHLRDTIFGALWLGRDSRTNISVALKMSSLDRIRKAIEHKSTRENPFEECKLLRILNTTHSHPHVLRLLDEFIHDRCHWGVLEFVDNGGVLYPYILYMNEGVSCAHTDCVAVLVASQTSLDLWNVTASSLTRMPSGFSSSSPLGFSTFTIAAWCTLT